MMEASSKIMTDAESQNPGRDALWQHAVWPVLLAFVVVGLYSMASIDNGFVYDDTMLILNQKTPASTIGSPISMLISELIHR